MTVPLEPRVICTGRSLETCSLEQEMQTAPSPRAAVSCALATERTAHLSPHWPHQVSVSQCKKGKPQEQPRHPP